MRRRVTCRCGGSDQAFASILTLLAVTSVLSPKREKLAALTIHHMKRDSLPLLLRVATINLRRETAEDRLCGESWAQRQGLIADIVKTQGLDIFGTQEGLLHQLHGLSRELEEDGRPMYNRAGEGRNWFGYGEHCAVYFRAQVMQLLAAGTFGLSDRPECRGRRAWGAACPRIATYTLLKLPDNHGTLLVINTHLDHVSAQARRESARLLVKRTADIEATVPELVPLAGDFNCAQSWGGFGIGGQGIVFATLVAAGFQSTSDAMLSEVPRYSFHGWKGDQVAADTCSASNHAHVDWILWRGNRLIPQRFAAITTRGSDGTFPSDHFPVLAEFAIVSPHHVRRKPLT